jgi:hypothetical protein
MTRKIVSLAAARHERQAKAVFGHLSSLQEKLDALTALLEIQLDEISPLIELVDDEDAASELIKQRDDLIRALEDAKGTAQDRIDTMHASLMQPELMQPDLESN